MFKNWSTFSHPFFLFSFRCHIWIINMCERVQCTLLLMHIKSILKFKFTSTNLFLAYTYIWQRKTRRSRRRTNEKLAKYSHTRTHSIRNSIWSLNCIRFVWYFSLVVHAYGCAHIGVTEWKSTKSKKWLIEKFWMCAVDTV